MDKIMTDTGLKSAYEVSRAIGSDRHTINADTITASMDWQGRLIRFTQACTVTIPADLPSHFSCGWSQESAGVITFVPANGETLQSVGGARKSAAQFSMGGIVGIAAATHRLYGDITV